MWAAFILKEDCVNFEQWMSPEKSAWEARRRKLAGRSLNWIAHLVFGLAKTSTVITLETYQLLGQEIFFEA